MFHRIGSGSNIGVVGVRENAQSGMDTNVVSRFKHSKEFIIYFASTTTTIGLSFNHRL